MRNVRMRKRARCDYEALRNARLLENKARLESLGVLNKASQLREASAQTKRVHGLTPLRRSQRIKAVTTTATVAAAATNNHQPRRSQRFESSSTQPVTPKLEKVTTNKEEEEEKRPASTPLEEEKKRPANAPLIELNDECRRSEERRKRGREMGNMRMRERTKCDYEALRNARLLENKARLESLGVLSKVSQLREASAQTKTPRPYHKRVYGLTPLRRSQRINAFATTPAAAATATATAADHFQPPRSQRLKSSSTQPVTPKQEKVTTNKGEEEKKRPANTPLEEEKKRPANAPLIELDDVDLLISAESSARRCDSKGRGTVYNGVLGICCHFCRQKKLCGEEDCKRCGNCDVDEPCLGKTDCSVCHSSTGVFCRACLKVRYGEEIEEVRENKGWMCPHCIEEKGINPYWICNSSICLRKRNMSPTGLAIYKAREMGYESVAHLLMEELRCGKRYKR